MELKNHVKEQVQDVNDYVVKDDQDDDDDDDVDNDQDVHVDICIEDLLVDDQMDKKLVQY